MYTFSFFWWIFLGAITYLLFKVSSLSKRISALENESTNRALSVPMASTSVQTLESDTPFSQVSSREERVLRRKVPSRVNSENIFSTFFIWFKKDWMLKVGALFLLAGMGWFVAYAFMENWVGPLGRITLGYALGIAFLVYGWNKMADAAFMKKAAVFFVVGASIIILTTYVARAVYDMFSAFTVIAIIFLTSAFVSLSAVRYEKMLGYAGLILGSIAPLLSHSHEDNYVFLFSYLAVVILGSHVIVHLTGQRGIIFAGLLVVAFYSMNYITTEGPPIPACSYVYPVTNQSLNDYSASPTYMCGAPTVPQVDFGVLLLFAYGFAAVFFLASVIGILRSSAMGSFQTEKTDLFTAIGTALYLIAWVLGAAPETYKGMILIAWMLVFVVGAFFLFKKVKERAAFYTYALVGIVLLGTATGVQLDGLVQFIAFTLEAAAIVVGTLYLLETEATALTMTWAFIVPILYSFSYIFDKISFLDAKSLSLFFLSLTLLFVSLLFYKTQVQREEKDRNYALFKFYLVSGSLYFWFLVWRNVSALFQNSSVSSTVSLIIFTAAGLGLYMAGKINESKGTVFYGSALSLFVIAHLILIDVWNMDLFGKVITFLVVGALLMASAFINKKNENHENK